MYHFLSKWLILKTSFFFHLTWLWKFIRKFWIPSHVDGLWTLYETHKQKKHKSSSPYNPTMIESGTMKGFNRTLYTNSKEISWNLANELLQRNKYKKQLYLKAYRDKLQWALTTSSTKSIFREKKELISCKSMNANK